MSITDELIRKKGIINRFDVERTCSLLVSPFSDLSFWSAYTRSSAHCQISDSSPCLGALWRSLQNSLIHTRPKANLFRRSCVFALPLSFMVWGKYLPIRPLCDTHQVPLKNAWAEQPIKKRNERQPSFFGFSLHHQQKATPILYYHLHLHLFLTDGTLQHRLRGQQLKQHSSQQQIDLTDGQTDRLTIQPELFRYLRIAECGISEWPNGRMADAGRPRV